MMALFTGSDAYVTPSWSATKRETGRVVPTWDHVAVHAYGEAEFFADEARLLGAVTRLTDFHEAAMPEPWSVTDAPGAYNRGQLREIFGLRPPVARIEGKREMRAVRRPHS